MALVTERWLGARTHDEQSGADTAILNDGGWVTAWLEVRHLSSGNTRTLLCLDRFDADGQMVADHVVIANPSRTFYPHVSAFATTDGGWGLNWYAAELNWPNKASYVSLFGDDGTLVSTSKYEDMMHKDNYNVFDNGDLLYHGSITNKLTNQESNWFYITDDTGTVLNKIKAVGANFDINGVDILHDQGWITAWTDYDKIEYARYDSSGTMIVSATTASQSNELINAAIQTTALEDGGWIISWTANTNYFFDRFDASGNEVTTEGRLNPSPRNVGTGNTIALEGGGWVATWFYREHIYFQRFDSDGAKSGDVVEVNSIESYYGQYDVKASSDDGLVFSWNGPSPDNEGDQNIYQQRYDAHNDVIFSNTAPTGTDAIIDIREDRTYNFTNNTFGYDDINHQAVAGVYITKLPEHGSLMLGTKAVHQGEFISAEQIREMTWTPGVNENGLKYATIDFKVADIGDDANGGHHIDPVANSLTFNVTAEQDAFNGTDGNDILVGTSTSDLFFGGAGNDKLTGLGGLDVFDFRPDTGVDTITDFTVDGQQHDVIVFLHFDDLNSFSHLMHYHTEQSGKDVVIHDFDPENDGSKIILSNVKLEDLHAKDFYFQS